MEAAIPPDVAALYVRYGAAVVRRARQILRNEDDAHEILQEVFVGFVTRPEKFRGASAASTFLYAVTTNACLNRLRDRRNRERLLEQEVRPWQVELDAGSGEARVIVLDLLGKLPDDEASAAIYYYLDGMSHPEIAEVLGCSRRQVGNLIERAHAHVRQLAEDAV